MGNSLPELKTDLQEKSRDRRLVRTGLKGGLLYASDAGFTTPNEIAHPKHQRLGCVVSHLSKLLPLI